MLISRAIKTFLPGIRLAVVAPLILVYLGCGSVGRQSRERWDRDAIRATYNVNDVYVEGNAIAIGYVWENRTPREYRLTSQPVIVPRLSPGKSLGKNERGILALELPISIPPGTSQRVRLRLATPCAVPPLRENASEEEHKERFEEIEATCLRTIPGLSGFVVFDQASGYEIRLPGGWRDPDTR